jgi:NADPH2:quinone reductase
MLTLTRYLFKPQPLLATRPLIYLSATRLHCLTNRKMSSGPSTGDVMKAIQVKRTGGIEVLEYCDVPRPKPTYNQLLVRNYASGVNFIDTYHRSGLYQLSLPFIPGREGAGEVVEVGKDVTDFQVGDRVAYIGGNSYAEYTAIDTQCVIRLPEQVSYETGAALLLQGLTAWTMIKEAYPVQPNDWILVHAAAGGTGRWLVRLCKRAGARVIGTVSTKEKEAIARADGADVVLNYSPLPEEQDGGDVAVDRRLLRDIMAATDGKGVHAALDGVGRRTFDLSLQSLRRLGTLITFGNASGPVPPVDVLRLSKGNYRLMRTTLFQYITTREEFMRYAEPLVRLVANGELEVPICATFSLKDAAKAHEFLEGRKTTSKVILKID